MEKYRLGGNATIKHTAITRAGYEYQDLVGIEVLIRHYRDPDLFEWVQIESDDPNTKALDDVIAMRRDGTVEYFQVKFTVDSEEYPLDWDWLLKKSGSGTSMLAKWAKSFARAKAIGSLHSAQLKTNRVPSANFAASMNGPLVDLAKIPATKRKLIEAECGGVGKAEAFFKAFAFTARMPNLEQFEASLRDQLIPTDTDSAGWRLLRAEVRRWAVLQREPPPDGRILREHVVRLISTKRPQPIRQDFLVPLDYSPPSEAFDGEIRSRIAEDAQQITVLWGTPGRGKSTYLSYLTNDLQQKGEVVIRHHYFLSSEDSSANRASYADIVASLYDQLRSHYPEYAVGVTEDAGNLRLDLGVTAENLARKRKRLYLIVDGLDHVYRDTHRTDQLNHLFNELLPLPKNISLVVGTQRVEDRQLPTKLLTIVRDDDWVEIPRMDEVAVHRWVLAQDQARPVALRWNQRRSVEMNEIAAAFFNISQGHPLHLIYAYETLVRTGRHVSKDDVQALPSCPDGDIRSYYKSLWLRISDSARRILHMLAGSDFFWPDSGIWQSIGDYKEIDFLLEPRNSGMMPFHGSIFAWVKERHDHSESYKKLLPKIVHWLKEDAPDYWRWGWFWLTEAANGNPAPLLFGATRDWVVDSLAKGWPERQIRNILTAAESISFASNDLPATVRFRALKTRIANARDFQALDFGTFRSSALSIADNRQQSLNLLDDLKDLSNEELSALAKFGPEAVRNELVDACYGELAHRITTWVVLRHHPGDHFSRLSTQFLSVAAVAGKNRVQDVIRFVKGFREPARPMSRYIEFLAGLQDSESLAELAASLKGKKWAEHRREIQQHVLRSALFKGADPLQLLKVGREKVPPVVAAWLAHSSSHTSCEAYIAPWSTDVLKEPVGLTDDADLKRFFCDAFWIALRTKFLAEGPCTLIYPPLRRGRLDFIDAGLDCIEELATCIVAGSLLWTFSSPFIAAADVSKIPFSGRGESRHVQYLGFRNALGAIALDLHLMGLPNKNVPEVSLVELQIARASSHWVDHFWIDNNMETKVRIFEKQAASEFLDGMSEALAEEVTEFHERADRWTKYATLCHLYGVGNPAEILRRAASCLVGYGYRKDMSAFETLESIREVHRINDSRTLEWLKVVTPIIDRITEFTDGDETDHARTELIDLVAVTYPDRLHFFYARHLAAEEWRYANECLDQYIRVADLETPEAAGLCGTLLDHITLGTLNDRANNNQRALELLGRQIQILGGLPQSGERNKNTPDVPLSAAQGIAVGRDPTAFEATDFAGIAKAVSSKNFPYGYRKAFLRKWLTHWHRKRKAHIALASVKNYFDIEDNVHDVEEILDVDFEVSLAAEGKESAYPWLVLAHIHRHGWHRYFNSREETTKRLKEAAELYPSRWMQFIHDSSKQTAYFNHRGFDFSIGGLYLIKFLLMVGQTEIASNITAEFVAGLVSEVGDQPIALVTWLR